MNDSIVHACMWVCVVCTLFLSAFLSCKHGNAITERDAIMSIQSCIVGIFILWCVCEKVFVVRLVAHV